MSARPHNADIVVKDLDLSLAFYALLGVHIPEPIDRSGPVNFEPEGGMHLGFFTEAMMGGSPMGWTPPVGQRISIAFKADSAAEVDAICAKAANAGHEIVMPPVDSPWGQRYSCLRDPDGNRVDLFADR